MNKFKTYAGTQPIYLGDIDFMQDAEKAMLTALARSLANSSSDTVKAILQGVKITQQSSDQLWITAGIVVLDGEVLPVPGQIISASASDTLYFHVESTMSGSRTFKDGVSRDCYESRHAIVNTTSSGGIPVSSVPRLYHRPDDFNCLSDSGTGQIRSGQLYRRNGFWFLDLNFEIGATVTTITGSTTFSSGITNEIYDDINVISTIPALINIRNKNVYAHVILSISKGSNRDVTVTIQNAEEIVSFAADQMGDLSVMLIPSYN